MPSTLPVVDQNLANYPPGISAALFSLYQQGLPFWLGPIAVDFSLADAAVIYTVPTLPSPATRLSVARVMLEVTADFTGGSSSAIGLSSSNTAYNTPGDVFGGASGLLLAALTAGFRGTDGAKPRVVLAAADTIKWNRIASAFTAGTGKIHMHCSLVPAT